MASQARSTRCNLYVKQIKKKKLLVKFDLKVHCPFMSIIMICLLFYWYEVLWAQLCYRISFFAFGETCLNVFIWMSLRTNRAG